MAKQAAAEEEARYTMRLPSLLYKALKKLAQDERRSINQQLICIITAQTEHQQRQLKEESDTSSPL